MIRINVHEQGLKEAQKALAELEKVCNGISGPNTASIHSRPRKDGADIDNETILEYLTAAKGDFVSLANNEDKGKVFQPVADEIVKLMQIALNPKMGQGIDALKAGEIRSAALLKGIKAYMELVTERINQQRPAKGTLKRVTPEYADWRQEEFGVGPDVVGIASGDLLDNIASGSARLSRK